MRRVRDHLARFHFLADAVERGEVDEQRLAALEAMDNIFAKIDFSVASPGKLKAEEFASDALRIGDLVIHPPHQSVDSNHGQSSA